MADEIDEELEKLNEELKKLGVEDKGYGYPQPPHKDSIFKFFRDILDLADSSKAANLNPAELGNLRLSVRHYQDLANYAEAENLDKVCAYFRTKAETILSTSLSKKGFLAQLFVTQIKKEQKLEKGKPKKKGWFSKPEKEEEE